MARWTQLGAAGLVTAGLSVFGCATSVGLEGAGGSSSEGGGGDEPSTSGSGGMGGAGGVDLSPCPDDCSAVPVEPCMMAVCNEETLACDVVPSPKDTPCDDGLFCTVGEACEEGVCGEGYQNTCGMNPDMCSIVTCSEATKACAMKAGPDGLECDDGGGDLCTVNRVCKGGVCQGVAKDCFFAPVPDECYEGVCNPATGDCEPMPGNDGEPCSGSGDLCMVQKTCSDGQCVGGFPKDCSGLTNGCNLGTCDPADGSCYQEPIPPGGECAEATDECNTGICDMVGNCVATPNPGVACPSQTNECNSGVCDASGACAAVPTPGVACPSATNVCNDGFCSAAGVCTPSATNDGAACDDGNSCTMGEACAAGACAGGVVGNYVVYFSEPFESNAAGWTFPAVQAGQVNEWAIGPAKASFSGGSAYGNEDPAMDHTPSVDNGIAGVVLGGYAAEVVHPQHYIESPPINVDVPGSVYLELWRWLNSDYTPYMKNTIDVWNGSAWVNIWATGGSPPVQDAAWTHVSYDITAFKNAALKVRFGFDIQSSGVFTVSSWNVDDVVIANSVCN